MDPEGFSQWASNPGTQEFRQFCRDSAEKLGLLWMQGHQLPERIQARAQLFQELADLSHREVAEAYDVPIETKEQ